MDPQITQITQTLGPQDGDPAATALRNLRIRLCACCGAEYDLDNCNCRFKCRRGCGKCERHCTGHLDSDLIYEAGRDRAGDYDEMEFRLG